ncbi:hypothetical protein [Spirosoma sp.]|uniref:hypothetical protein n=1 Tax=Spirosoma sp. TaxID=1899569 RepID=UPI003B3A9A2E
MIAVGLFTLLLLNPRLDSIPSTDTVSFAHSKIRPAFNLDFRNSFLENQRINVWGVNAGITYGQKRHQITLGYYWISYATYLKLIDWRRDAAQRINLDYYTRTDMWFMSLMYWRNITNNKKWLVSVPIEVGGGVAYALPTSLQREVPIDRTKQSFLVPLQLGIYGQWRATRWVGLSAQLGYRVVVFRTAIDQNFNGSYYSVGISIYPTLATDIWRWVKTGDRISPVHAPKPRKK